jgi:hypothetical protein
VPSTFDSLRTLSLDPWSTTSRQESQPGLLLDGSMILRGKGGPPWSVSWVSSMLGRGHSPSPVRILPPWPDHRWSGLKRSTDETDQPGWDSRGAKSVNFSRSTEQPATFLVWAWRRCLAAPPGHRSIRFSRGRRHTKQEGGEEQAVHPKGYRFASPPGWRNRRPRDRAPLDRFEIQSCRA